MAADEVVQDIYEYVQELSLVKFFGIESRQPLVTDVDGEALAIADGVREMVARFWRNPERSEAFLQRKLWILQMNREQRYSDPRSGLVCMLTSGVEGLVDVTGKVGEVRIEPESGDFTAIGFSVSVAARTSGICIAFVPSHSDT